MPIRNQRERLVRFEPTMPVGGDNLFGLTQFDGKTSFFSATDTILSQVRPRPPPSAHVGTCGFWVAMWHVTGVVINYAGRRLRRTGRVRRSRILDFDGCITLQKSRHRAA